jgi:hypothetical protein
MPGNLAPGWLGSLPGVLTNAIEEIDSGRMDGLLLTSDHEHVGPQQKTRTKGKNVGQARRCLQGTE